MTLATNGRLPPISTGPAGVHRLGTTLWTIVDLGVQRQGVLGNGCVTDPRNLSSPQVIHHQQPFMHSDRAYRHAWWPANTSVVPIVHRTDDDVRVSNDGDNKTHKTRVKSIDCTGAGLENYSGMMAAHVGRVWKVGAA
jgi:hypothetical protein